MLNTLRFAALALTVSLGTTAVATADTASGTVNGTNTVDRIIGMKTQGETVTVTVSATGNGNNKLIIKVEQQKANGNWKTLQTMTVNPGSTSSMTYTVRDEFSSTQELLRYRLSRKIGTKAISYSLQD